MFYMIVHHNLVKHKLLCIEKKLLYTNQLSFNDPVAKLIELKWLLFIKALNEYHLGQCFENQTGLLTGLMVQPVGPKTKKLDYVIIT